MAINKVDLTVTQLINDLNEGYTWLKKDDLGYGSIEVKYGANEKQIAAIRKHPKLKDAETSVTIFNIIDDTKDETTVETTKTTSKSSTKGTGDKTQSELLPVGREYSEMDTLSSDISAADIFANL